MKTKSVKLKLNGGFLTRRGNRWVKTANAENGDYFTLEDLKEMVGRVINPGDDVELVK